ncbi:hypothetical protein L332_10330 [Agrococcus pavilionensis RW1]|uniref:Helix-turn-helix domain-containing protein n=1 Tax=Agrococcus pavilionensis RW1 TaxID=1330458 RepID=U1LCF7_9MICO|nr:hypothetical protein [Agrococcus pavilionensis]ERG64838.1 hypothetical protein L332_10330 [Agrococcus pavilionensis RW1]
MTRWSEADQLSFRIQELESRVKQLEKVVSSATREPRWADVYQVAEHLRASTRLVRDLTKSGVLTRYGRPRLYRWDLNEVDAAFLGHTLDTMFGGRFSGT